MNTDRNMVYNAHIYFQFCCVIETTVIIEPKSQNIIWKKCKKMRRLKLQTKVTITKSKLKHSAHLGRPPQQVGPHHKTRGKPGSIHQIRQRICGYFCAARENRCETGLERI